jgi:predicted acetyltransferase
VDFEIHWGGAPVVPMGGIAGVATFNEARGRGYVDALLRDCLERMRAKGQALSALYPFAWAFYRRYGWDWVGEQRRLTLPLREVRASPEGRNVREIRAKDVAETAAILKPIYSRFAAQYRGVFGEGSHRWDDKLRADDNRTTYAYVHEPPGGGGPDGYLLWRYGREGSTGQVREFVATTPDAYRGLLSLLHYVGTQADKAQVTVPADNPLWSHVMHWDVETRIAPVFMGRVVDVAAALRALVPAAGVENGAVRVAIRDPHAPWNQGTWRVTVEVGAVACDLELAGAAGAAAAPAADIACDIQAFSQAFWGTPSLGSLHRVGRVEAADEGAVAFLDRVLAGPPVFTLDDF